MSVKKHTCIPADKLDSYPALLLLGNGKKARKENEFKFVSFIREDFFFSWDGTRGKK